MKTWNRERKRTRDRLLDYYITPNQMDTNLMYPWSNISPSMLFTSLYQLAQKNGFNGTEEEFKKFYFNREIVTGTLDTFEIPGDSNKLYLDTDTGILYFFTTELQDGFIPARAEMGSYYIAMRATTN